MKKLILITMITQAAACDLSDNMSGPSHIEGGAARIDNFFRSVRDMPHIEKRVDELEQKEFELTSRISTLGDEVVDLEKTIERERADLHFYKCEARVAKIESEIAGLESRCLKVTAEYEKCLSKNSETLSITATLGAGLGAAAALAFSAGLAAPVIIGGVAGTATGSAISDACGEAPPCVRDFDMIKKSKLKEYGEDGIPKCVRSSYKLVREEKVVNPNRVGFNLGGFIHPGFKRENKTSPDVE